MKQVSKNIDDINQLEAILSATEIREPAGSALSILIHIYTAFTNKVWLQAISQKIQQSFPSAHVIGATTCGEILNGETVLEQTVINFTFFSSTQIHPFVMPIIAGEELAIGQQLRHFVDELGDRVPAIMLLTTPLTTNANEIAQGLMLSPPSFEIFGGGAGDYSLKTNYVMYGSTIYAAAVIAIVFQGHELQVEKTSFLGWCAMSNGMTITQASGNTIHTIDGRPAFEIYQHYFNIQNDAKFFSNALGFPFLINRNGQIIALVPVAVGLNNSLEFISTVYEGEILSIGFMDTDLIHKNLTEIQNKMLTFQPESLLIYSCGCRRWALRDDIKSETNAFEKIAPTAGFYTVGEFCNQGTTLPQLNLAFVIVGMREGRPIAPLQPALNPLAINDSSVTDIYNSSHLNVITRLSYFNNVLSHELLIAKEKAEQLSKIKSQFLANMSHEIRTPMAAIIGFSEIALLKDMPVEINDYLKNINTASNNLLEILNDILDLSKIEAGQMRLNLSAFSLQELQKTLVNLFIKAAHKKGLALNIGIANDVPDYLIGDSVRLRQVLINLVGNAIKFTQQGAVTLSISLQQIIDQQARLLFAVTDSGIGMSAEQQAKLFLSFSQVDDGYDRNYEGTGLGLVISQNLVQLMDGLIKVESNIGLGSCFSFELLLPIAVSPIIDQTKESINIALSALNNEAEILKGIKILVAEDNFFNQMFINEILENLGASIVLANNGLEALAALEKDDFDVILMDLHMPVMNGYEATLEIRKQVRYAGLPVITLSAGVTDDEKRASLAAGMNDFVSKPINKIELLATLERWLKR